MEPRISVFGDSIVWGAADYECGGWVARLRKYFEAKRDNEMTVYNLGVSGDTTTDLLKRFNVECSARNRHSQIIIFSIGVNDSQYINYKNNPRTPIDVFENNLIQLVSQAKKYSDKIIFVGLLNIDEKKTMPIPWAKEKFYDNENILEYDSIIQKVCKENKLPFISLINLLDMNEYEDGLHPNSIGHQKIFLKIKEFLIDNNIIE